MGFGSSCSQSFRNRAVFLDGMDTLIFHESYKQSRLAEQDPSSPESARESGIDFDSSSIKVLLIKLPCNARSLNE